MTQTERLRADREKLLPSWAHGLSARVQHVLLNAANERNGLLSCAPHDVRAYGKDEWLRWPNMGKAGIRELGQAMGGWMDQEPIDGWE